MNESTRGASAERIVQEWIDSDQREAVDAAVVPGPDARERQRLASLGGLTRTLIERSIALDYKRHLDAIPALKEWFELGPVAPDPVVSAAQSLLASPGEDALARMYSSAVSSANRRRLGTFFTPLAEVEQMVSAWESLGVKPSTVVDVGAGVGIFTLAATKRWPEAQVHAVDVNPVTLGLLGLRAATEGQLVDRLSDSPGIRLHLEDYVTFAQTELSKFPGPRLVLGNPPYTRIQLLPQQARDALIRAADGLCGSRASLSALITAVTIRHLGDRDGLCLLLPAQWLESDYALNLREWLWSVKSRAIHLHLFDQELFADAQVDAVSLLVGPAVEGEPQQLHLSGGKGRVDRQMFRSGQCPPNWRALFSKRTASSASEAGVALSQIATVKRGVATGANDFFVVSETTRVQNGLSRSLLKPLVRRLRDHRGEEVTNESLADLPQQDKRWLLFAGAHDLNQETLRAYLATGEEQHLHERVLCSKRASWFDLRDETRPPDVIVGPATKSNFRFVVNAAEAYVTNNLYGLFWKTWVPLNQREEVLEWLRNPVGQSSIAASARTQGGGLLKIEPRAFNAIKLPWLSAWTCD